MRIKNDYATSKAINEWTKGEKYAERIGGFPCEKRWRLSMRAEKRAR